MLDTLPAFAAATLQRPGKVLGRRLMPYSLGHELLLVRLHSPLLQGGAAELGDVLLALEVLWRAYPEALAVLQEETKLARRLKRRAWLVQRLLGPDWAQGAVLRLRSYLVKGRQGPPIKVLQEQGDSTNISLLQLMVLKLVKAGFDPEQVWEMPYRQALWHHAALMEMGGTSLCIGDDKEEMEEAVKRLFPGRELVRFKEAGNG